MSKTNTSGTIGIHWRNLRTGALVVIGIAIAAMLGLIIGKNTSLFSRHDTATIFLKQINGLSEGNMITVSGKKIGVVKTIEFARRNDTSGVIVTLDIAHEFFPLITSDSKVMVRSLGILGDKYIDINLGRSPLPLADGGALESFTEPGFEELTASAITTMNTIESISTKINNGEGSLGKILTTTELHDKLASAVDHLDKMTSNIDEATHAMMHGNGLMARAINDTSMASHAAALVANLHEVSSSLTAGRGTLGKLMVDESLYNKLTSVTSHADSVLARLNNPSGTLGKLTGDDALYKRLDHSILSLDSLLIDLKANPGRYVRVSVF